MNEMTRALLLCLAAASLLPGQSPQVDSARKLYETTGYSAALSALKGAPASAGVLALQGKCYYGLGDYKRAVELLEKAVAASPSSAANHHWLGRAWGRRAENANVFQAPGFARHARDSFEKAVKLDPANLEAVSDLFQYYMEAPGFLGGGSDKAAALAETVKGRNAAEYEYLQAQLAQDRKQDAVAEKRLRRAAELEPKSVGRWCDLARFLARRGRHDESDKLFQQAAKLDPASPKWRYSQAAAWIEAKRNSAEARRLLNEYISGPLTPDDATREEARGLLRKIGS